MIKSSNHALNMLIKNVSNKQLILVYYQLIYNLYKQNLWNDLNIDWFVVYILLIFKLIMCVSLHMKKSFNKMYVIYLYVCIYI